MDARDDKLLRDYWHTLSGKVNYQGRTGLRAWRAYARALGYHGPLMLVDNPFMQGVMWKWGNG